MSDDLDRTADNAARLALQVADLRRERDTWKTVARNAQGRIDLLIALRNELLDRPNQVATLAELDAVLLRTGPS